MLPTTALALRRSTPPRNTESPSSSSPSPFTAQHAPQRPPMETETQSRRVYSPYADQAGFKNPNNNDDDDFRDALDYWGEKLADFADRIMWGKFDAPSSSSQAERSTAPFSTARSSTRAGTTTGGSSSSRSDTSSTRRPHSRRHWKDRMEERLDSMLGIHENGKYYDSWMQRQRDQVRAAEGTDPVSYARGRARATTKGRPRGGGGGGFSKNDDKPLWEQEGTLWTLLFGRGSAGQKLAFRDTIDGEPGQLLGVVQLVLRSGLVGAGYACRWASVRGSIPQPLVVMAVCSAALCARKHRLRAVLFVLLGLRTLGELIHGYVLGDEGWRESAAEEGEYDDDEYGAEGRLDNGDAPQPRTSG